MPRRLILLLFAVCLTFVCHADTKDTPSIRSSHIGFNAQFVNRRWQPARTEIENPGPGKIVTLILEPSTRDGGQSLVLTKPVWLPPQSRRTVWLSGFPDIKESSLPPPARKERDEIRILKCLSIKLTDGALGTYHTDYILGRFIPESSIVVLTADSRHTSYKVPAETSSPSNRRPIMPVPVSIDSLPTRAADLDAASLLILGDPGSEQLLPLQRQAILDWVRAGGTLVIGPGKTTNDAWFAHWEEITPATFGPFDRFATDPRLVRWGESPVFPNGISLRRLTLRDDARVLVGDRYSPLVAVRQEGLGRVVTTAFDLGNLDFQHWSGAVQFGAELIALAQLKLPAADHILEKSPATDAIVSSLAGIKVLERGLLLGYLALILAIIVGLLIAFRFMRSPEHGWLVAALAATLTGAGAILLASHWKSQPWPFLNEIDIIHVAPDGSNAVAQAAFGLYSPRSATFQLAAGNSSVTLRPHSSNKVSAEPFGLELDDTLRIPALAVRQNDVRAMYGQALLAPVPQPRAKGRITSTGLDITIENPTGNPLADSFFKFNRLVAPLGDIPAIAQREFHGLQAGEAYSSHIVQSAENQLRDRIRRVFFPDPVYTLGQGQLDTLASFQSYSPWNALGPAAYAWTQDPIFPLDSSNKNLARRAINLWNIPVTLTYEGPRLMLPRGLLTLRLRNKESRLVERAEGRYSGTRRATILAEFSLPTNCPDLHIDSAKVLLRFHGSAFRAHVSIESPDSKQKLSLTGDTELPIHSPAQWYNPFTRSFTVAVNIDPSVADGQQFTSVSYWQIRELDMEIGGTIP